MQMHSSDHVDDVVCLFCSISSLLQGTIEGLWSCRQETSMLPMDWEL
jgi:hypothetical protein